MPTSKEHPSFAYRREIDGLRAVAIALVVGYHVAPRWCPGGFVGVDVFFVLSGFLITGILLREETWQLRRFYARRVRRLAPALVVVLAATLALGSVSLLGDAFRDLARHMVAATLFVANVHSWMGSGYFEAAAIDQPLLHLWSLGVEEQFYLVWPFLLWALARHRSRMLGAIVVMGGISFVACVALVGEAPSSVFFLPWFRFWEFLAGAVLAVRPAWSRRLRQSRSLAEAGALGGLAAILAFAFAVDATTPFPSWSALAPVLGTAVLVATGDETWVARTLLMRRTMVGIGLVSYPLYLWHWSLISLLAESHPVEGVASRALVCLGALLLAIGTWLFVEKPVQGGFRRRPRVTVAALSGAMLGLMGISFALQLGQASLAESVHPGIARVERAQHLDASLRSHLPRTPCPGDLETSPERDFCGGLEGEGVEGPVLLWGDSMAGAWFPVVESLAQEHGLGFELLSINGCPPLLGVQGESFDGCRLEDLEWKLAMIEAMAPSHIVLAGAWINYYPEARSHPSGIHYRTTVDGVPADEGALAKALEDTVEKMLDLAPVVVFLPLPVLDVPVHRALVTGEEYRPLTAEHLEAVERMKAVLEPLAEREVDLSVFDPSSRLCGAERCEAILDDTFFYYDALHITAQGSLKFREDIDELLWD